MPDTDKVLDVRIEIPARRHELIFRTYVELDYLEQGPQVWRVRIGRPAA